MSTATEFTLNFRSPSQVLQENQTSAICLATPTQVSPSATGQLFKGEVADPLLFRDLLLFLSDIVQSRFYRPDWWRHRDPVVTCETELIRLECFSSCASVYGRVDCDAGMFKGYELVERGTTNVNFNPDFIQGLNRLRPNQPVTLAVGESFVALESGSQQWIEEKVKLPERWVKGFLQSQAIYRKAQKWMSLNAMATKQLITQIRSGQQEESYLLPIGNGLQLLHSPPHQGDYLAVSGLNRLTLLKKLLPHLKGLDIYTVPGLGATAWIALTTHASVMLGLSASVSQGFSGEGEALRSLSLEQNNTLLAWASQMLAELPHFTLAELPRLLEITEAESAQLVDTLAIQGVLGYDCRLQQYFYRELPFSAKIPNRLANAQALLAESKIEIETCEWAEKALTATGWVQGNAANYFTELQVTDHGYLAKGSCTCQWVQDHGLKRGPCKHLMALRFACEEKKRSGK